MMISFPYFYLTALGSVSSLRLINFSGFIHNLTIYCITYAVPHINPENEGSSSKMLAYNQKTTQLKKKKHYAKQRFLTHGPWITRGPHILLIILYHPIRTGNLLKHNGVPNVLPFTNYAFCPHCVNVGFVWFWEQTLIISTNNTIQLDLVTEMYCAFFEARTELKWTLGYKGLVM
jgi:hypothetical protein